MTDIPAGPQIAVDTVCRIILRAREFDVKEGAVDEDDASNPADDGFKEVLAGTPDDPTFDELRGFIDDLNVDDQCDLVTLVWIGRGDYSADGWAEARALAQQQHNARTAAYLLGIPLLADFLEEGLSQFNMSCDDVEGE